MAAATRTTRTKYIRRNHDSRTQILITVANVILIIILLSCRRPSPVVRRLLLCLSNAFVVCSTFVVIVIDSISFHSFDSVWLSWHVSDGSHSHVIRTWTSRRVEIVHSKMVPVAFAQWNVENCACTRPSPNKMQFDTALCLGCDRRAIQREGRHRPLRCGSSNQNSSIK